VSDKYEIGDLVVYQYGQVRFAGTVIAVGRALDADTGAPLQSNDGLRYIVQQMSTGVLHVYSGRNLVPWDVAPDP
jgi:hypothetical protein